jgi:hypothetical protein
MTGHIKRLSNELITDGGGLPSLEAELDVRGHQHVAPASDGIHPARDAVLRAV